MENKYGLTVTSIQKYGFEKALKVFEKYNHKCSVCGSSDYLAIHHIDGKGSHYKEKCLEPNDSLDNLQLICRRCHGSMHAKEYWAKSAENRGGYLWKGKEKEYNIKKHREWREKNRKKYTEYQRKYYQEHKLKTKEGEE
jgi:hypothetical protein